LRTRKPWSSSINIICRAPYRASSSIPKNQLIKFTLTTRQKNTISILPLRKDHNRGIPELSTHRFGELLTSLIAVPDHKDLLVILKHPAPPLFPMPRTRNANRR